MEKTCENWKEDLLGLENRDDKTGDTEEVS